MRSINNISLVKKLYRMLDTLVLINSVQDLDRPLALIMKAIKDIMECRASSLMLLDTNTDELYFTAIEGGSERVKEIRIDAKKGIAGRVVQTGEPLIINDVHKSKIFLKAVDQKTSFKTKSIIAVPLVSRNKTIGVIEALNKNRNEVFTREDLKLFTIFSNQLSIAIENTKLYNMAFYDGLTKVFTRQYIDAWLETEYARVKRYNTDLSVIMFDIDRFKKINDTYGHQAGDFVLSQIADTVKNITRHADVFGRYGGEEFLICLPETKPEMAVNSAERIRKIIEEKTFIYDGKKISATISLGITCFRNSPEDTVEKFIKNTNAALYKSKENGRNRVTVFGY